MRTKEFLKKVEELGCIVEEGIASYDIRLYKELGGLIATLNKKDPYRMLFFTKPSCNNEKLFDLCVEYAKTPIEEREAEKKYYLRLKDDFYKISYAYLTRNIQDGDYFSFGKHELKGAQNKFTQKEIDEIKKKFNTDLSEFKQIEVKE